MNIDYPRDLVEAWRMIATAYSERRSDPDSADFIHELNEFLPQIMQEPGDAEYLIQVMTDLKWRRATPDFAYFCVQAPYLFETLTRSLLDKEHAGTIDKDYDPDVEVRLSLKRREGVASLSSYMRGSGKTKNLPACVSQARLWITVQGYAYAMTSPNYESTHLNTTFSRFYILDSEGERVGAILAGELEIEEVDGEGLEDLEDRIFNIYGNENSRHGYHPTVEQMPAVWYLTRDGAVTEPLDEGYALGRTKTGWTLTKIEEPLQPKPSPTHSGDYRS